MIIRELPRCILCQQSLYVFVIKLYHLINRSIATKHVHSHYQINKNVTNEYQHRSKIKGELPKKSQLLKSQLKSIATGYRYLPYLKILSLPIPTLHAYTRPRLHIMAALHYRRCSMYSCSSEIVCIRHEYSCLHDTLSSVVGTVAFNSAQAR